MAANSSSSRPAAARIPSRDRAASMSPSPCREHHQTRRPIQTRSTSFRQLESGWTAALSRLFRFLSTASRWPTLLGLSIARWSAYFIVEEPTEQIGELRLLAQNCFLMYRSAVFFGQPRELRRQITHRHIIRHIRPIRRCDRLPTRFCFAQLPANFLVPPLIVCLPARDGQSRINLQTRPSVVPFDFQALHVESIEDDHGHRQF